MLHYQVHNNPQLMSRLNPSLTINLRHSNYSSFYSFPLSSILILSSHPRLWFSCIYHQIKLILCTRTLVLDSPGVMQPAVHYPVRWRQIWNLKLQKIVGDVVKSASQPPRQLPVSAGHTYTHTHTAYSQTGKNSLSVVIMPAGWHADMHRVWQKYINSGSRIAQSV
jgi:hypothetical protein